MNHSRCCCSTTGTGIKLAAQLLRLNRSFTRNFHLRSTPASASTSASSLTSAAPCPLFRNSRRTQSRNRNRMFSTLVSLEDTPRILNDQDENADIDTMDIDISSIGQNGAFLNSIPEPNIATLPGNKTSLNLYTTINQTLDTALSTDPSAIIFGEDVAFGGVFRCTTGLRDKYGPHRVFNTPLSEVGIAGIAAGYASTDSTAIGEIQFADYMYPAFDQIHNEIAKFRYRSGNQWNCGGVTLRMPCGAVGHGGHYHSQSPEGVLAGSHGIVVVMPRGPISAKGLLLSSIRSEDPVVFLEPKVLYRSAVEDVPDVEYEIPLGKAEIIQEGSDVTIVGWGAQLRTLSKACDMAQSKYGISTELIDLRTILPWDVHTIEQSVKKTGKLIVSHEAPVTCGFGAEVVATMQERCFYSLEAPIRRICGYDTPFPLVFEKQYLPDEYKNLEAILDVMEYSR